MRPMQDVVDGSPAALVQPGLQADWQPSSLASTLRPPPPPPGRSPLDIPAPQWYHWGMSDHRIRLSDDDLALIVSALKARAAMTSGLRRHRVERLASRLAEGSRGNPKLVLGELEQTHEDDLDLDDLGD